MGKTRISLFILIFCFLLVLETEASQNILINEVSIDRTPQAVELVNRASESADIADWYIDDNGGTSYFTIPKNTVIYPNSCLVVEGDFNLNKASADSIRLFNSTAPPTATNASLIDSYAYKSGPGSGNSFSRYPDASNNWLAIVSTLGQWNESGAYCIVTPTATPTPTPSPTLQPTILSSPSESIVATITPFPSYDNIFINEVYPYPETGGKEWVELYNGNGYDIFLDRWYLDDVENGGGIPRQFSTTVPALQYAVIELQSPLYNNSADNVRLLDHDKKEKDGFEYGKAEKGKSFARVTFDGEQFCLEEPSKGQSNHTCLTAPTTINSVSSAATGSLETIVSPAPHKEPKQTPYTSSTTSISLGTVLGDAAYNLTGSSVSKKPSPIRYLASVSFSYAILTIVSLLIKIRNGLKT